MARLMRHQIYKTFGVNMSCERVRPLIKAAGYSLVRPRHKSNRVDDAEKRAEIELSGYKRRAQQAEIRLFILDEIKLMLLAATLTRIWGKMGRQAKVLNNDNYESCRGYMAID